MILLGLGSNLPSTFGDRFKNIELAIDALNGYGIMVKKQSSYYESLSYPNKTEPKFINVVIEVESNPAPAKYAAKLLGLCGDEIRLPLVNIKKETEQEVKKALSIAKLI